MLHSARMAKRHLMKQWDGEKVLREKYARIHGDLSNPITFTQKLFRRMIELHRKPNPLFTQLADKVLVRDYVRERLGDSLLVDMLWHGEDPASLPFDDLPQKSVAKTNHNCNGNILITSETDRQKAISQLREWLKFNYYWMSREAHYYHIKPQVLVEAFIDDGAENGPLDYRFWCFHGKAAAIQVDNHTHDLNAFYDQEWKTLRLSYRSGGTQQEVDRPQNLQEMVKAAETLSAGIDFVRVDLYNVNGRPLFGEMTFTPTGGANRFDPPEWDLKFGQLWT